MPRVKPDGARNMRCLSCDYSLQDLPEPRCPECGRKFDPNDSRSYADGRERPLSLTAIVGLAGVAFLMAFAVFFFPAFGDIELGLLPNALILATIVGGIIFGVLLSTRRKE